MLARFIRQPLLSSMTKRNISTKSSALRFRPVKKTRPPGKDAWSVVGYATASRYNLLALSERLTYQGLYSPLVLSDDLDGQVLAVRADLMLSSDKEKDIFFFSDGSVIFWNVPELERASVLGLLRASEAVEADPIDEDTVHEESELMSYALLTADGSQTHLDPRGTIRLNVEDSLLAKYAFSNAVAASVKLGALEARLDRVIDSIEFIAEDLRMGAEIFMSRDEVLKKTGEIFGLRHVINLSSDLLDTPDFYWDRERLENLYHTTCSHLAINKRTRVVNDKLDHCCDLMSLVTTHLNDKHHVRLEWFIIILIMVEVVFELMHFVQRFRE